MSKYSDKFFIINQKKGTLDINKKEVRQFPIFREIIERDKGGKVKGDSDGRKKLFAFMELYYVYAMADPFCQYSILNNERRTKAALQDSGLYDLDKNWKPDNIILEAIEYYKEKYVNLSPLAYTMINARKGLYGIGKDLEFYNIINDNLRVKIQNYQKDLMADDILEEDVESLQLKLQKAIESLNKNNKDILEITNALPNRIDSLEKLKVKLAEEDSELDTVIGSDDRHVYNREDV